MLDAYNSDLGQRVVHSEFGEKVMEHKSEIRGHVVDSMNSDMGQKFLKSDLGKEAMKSDIGREAKAALVSDQVDSGDTLGALKTGLQGEDASSLASLASNFAQGK